MGRLLQVCVLAILSVSLVIAASQRLPALAQTAAPPAAELRISGAVSTPLVLTITDLKSMPRKKLTVANPHDAR